MLHFSTFQFFILDAAMRYGYHERVTSCASAQFKIRFYTGRSTMGSSDSDLRLLDNAITVIGGIAGVLGGVVAALGLVAFVGAGNF